tara:strand:- start:357 stop:671 length:315 start_codon:yes stop_codon:yes gene_type:complete
MNKVKDLVIKIGEYQKDGETKSRWQNVGAMMQGDDGNSFLLLERWVNLAGVPDYSKKGNSTSVLISLFDAKDSNGQAQQMPAANNAPAKSQGAASKELDDDIPF